MRALATLGPILGLAVAATALAAGPTPTPTPRPRLSGGFGRPAATPIVSENGGQALSDVVRAATQARTRKDQKPGVAITNESLVTDPKKGRLTTSQPRNLPVPSAAVPTPAPTPAPGTTPGISGEAQWRDRARRARQRVEEDKARVFQLEGEASALEKDFYKWDDGQYRDGVIKPAWDRKKQELESARNDLAEAEKELAELPEQARKAGALPGWIRE